MKTWEKGVSRNNIEPPRWSPFAAAGEVIFYFANPLIDHCRLSRVDFTAQYFFSDEKTCFFFFILPMADHLKEKETVWIANWRAYNIRHIIFNSSYRERNSESPSERERTPKITIGSIEYCVVLSIKIGQSEMEGTKCWPLCFPIMFDTGATVSLAPAFKPNEKKKSERKLAHKLEIKKEYNNNRNGNRKKERSTRLFIDSF